MEWKLAKNKHFVSIAGLKQVYEPEQQGPATVGKHPCKDCHFCQQCSDARCHACRDTRKAGGRGSGPKLSIREQIALFEQINREENEPRSGSE